jgi:hypothetical protein
LEKNGEMAHTVFHRQAQKKSCSTTQQHGKSGTWSADQGCDEKRNDETHAADVKAAPQDDYGEYDRNEEFKYGAPDRQNFDKQLKYNGDVSQ